ncbi:MAG: hypothetical protein IKP35_03050 [Alphaproteobacteria bacterium]|nr:hypothetical protein [Alphaproteobacteria bacterium]
MGRKIIDLNSKRSLVRWAIFGTAGLFAVCIAMSALGRSKLPASKAVQNQEICDGTKVYKNAIDTIPVKAR